MRSVISHEARQVPAWLIFDVGQKMSTHHYIEDKAPAKRHYELGDGVLKISGKQGFGRFATEIRLSDVAPHFERVTCFHHSALRRATIYLAIVAGMASISAQLTPLPRFVIIGVTALIASPALIVLFRFSRPLEIERFKSHSGVVLFDVIREKKHAAEFVGSSRVDLQACKLEYSIVSPK